MPILLSGRSLAYDESDSFTPNGPAQDLYRHVLPNPTGLGKDWGAWLNMFDGRFVARLNVWKSRRINARNGDAGTIAGRVLRLGLASADSHQLEDQARAWVAFPHPKWNRTQILNEVARQIGLPFDGQEALIAQSPGLAATQDASRRAPSSSSTSTPRAIGPSPPPPPTPRPPPKTSRRRSRRGSPGA